MLANRLGDARGVAVGLAVGSIGVVVSGCLLGLRSVLAFPWRQLQLWASEERQL